MCRLRNIAMRDYQESVTTGQTDAQTLVKVIPMCFTGDTKMDVFVKHKCPKRQHSPNWLF